MMTAIGLWLYGVIRTVQIYEAEIDLWRAKKGLPPLKEKYDRKAILVRIKQKGGKRNVQYTLEEMINNPRRAIVNMSLVVSLTFIATKVNGFLDKVWIANINEDAVAAIATISPIYSVVSAIVFTGLGLLRLILFTMWGNSTMEVVALEIFVNILNGVIMFVLLLYFAKKFDPDKVNEKSRKRSNVFTILKERRAET